MPQSEIELSPEENHSHYNEEVKASLKIFQDALLSYYVYINFPFRHENYYRIDAVQDAWNALLKARKDQTGIGYYLTKEQYQRYLQKNGNHRRLSD